MPESSKYLWYVKGVSKSSQKCLDESTTRPAEVRRRLLDPVDELLSLDLCALIRRLHFDLFPVDKLPLLFLDDDQALLQLVAAE